jgi:hypothetical protein
MVKTIGMTISLLIPRLKPWVMVKPWAMVKTVGYG